MDEPRTDPRANDEIPAYVAGVEAWKLRRELHAAAEILEPLARSHPDPEMARALDAIARLCRRAVNLANATGSGSRRWSWWRRLLRRIAS